MSICQYVNMSICLGMEQPLPMSLPPLTGEPPPLPPLAAEFPPHTASGLAHSSPPDGGPFSAGGGGLFPPPPPLIGGDTTPSRPPASSTPESSTSAASTTGWSSSVTRHNLGEAGDKTRYPSAGYLADMGEIKKNFIRLCIRK